jgi:Lon protease-like protein
MVPGSIGVGYARFEMSEFTIVETKRVVLPGETHSFPVVEQRLDHLSIGDRIAFVHRERDSRAAVGVLATIETIAASMPGAVVLTVRGEMRVLVGVPDGPANAGTAEAGEELGAGADKARAGAAVAASRYQATLAELGYTADVLQEVPEDPIDASYRLASLLRVSEPERQHVLECGTAAKRLRLLATVFTRERALLEATISAGGR